MKNKLLLLFSLLFIGITSMEAQTCTETASATGLDNDPVVVSFTSFPCAAGQPLTSLSLTTTNTSANCNNWYSYNISVTHSGGTETTTGNCNVTDLDISTFNGATIDVTTVTAITITSFDDDGWFSGDGVTIDASLEVGFVAPACALPTGISNTTTNDTTATISWTDSTSEDSGYNWEVVPTGNGQGNGVVDSGTTSANATSATIAGLSSNTTYDFYIRSNCGGSQSIWSAVPFSFTTLPACGDTLTGLCYSQTSTIEVLASFEATSGNWAEIVFNSGGIEDCCDELVVYDGLNGTGNIIYGALTGGTETSDLSTLAAVVSTTGQISLAINSDSSATCSSSASIDPISITVNCVTPPSCIAPSDLAAGSITSDSASLSWTENNSATAWEIVVQAPGTGEPAGSGTEAPTNPYTASSLDANTAYEYYVRSSCGGSDGNSDWAGPFNFRTACVAVTSFDENFDSVSTPNLPDCWTELVENGASSSGYVRTSTSADNSAPNGVQLYYSNSSVGDIILVSPLLSNLGDGTHRLIFDGDTSSSTQDVIVGTLSDPNDASTFTAIQTFDLTFTYTTFEQSFASYSGTDKYIGFKRIATSTFTNVYLDNIKWEPIPSCVVPTDLAAGSITSDSASLSWTENNSATAWEVVVQAPGTGEPAGSGTEAPTNPYTASGLDANTAYEYYVRSNCGGGDLSAWAGPFSFTTTCAIFSPEYTEDFTSYLPGCWSEAKGELDAPTTFTSTSSSNWTSDGFAQSGLSGAAKMNVFSTGRYEWLVSPSISLDGGQQLVFDLAYNDFGTTNPAETTGSDDVFAVIISTDNGATWSSANTLKRWDNAGSTDVLNDISNSGETIIINLSSYTGTVKIGFYAESTVSNADNDLTIDNFIVQDIPSCPLPNSLSAGSITATSASLSWTENGTATVWDIEWGASGFTQGDGTAVTDTTDNPYSLTGLTANTTYEYYVRADCGGSAGESTWAGPFSFTTLPGAHAFPLTEDFESGFTLFDNAPGNDVDWTVSTTYFKSGSQSIHNAHGSSNENIAHETGVLDLSGTSNALLEFWHIAKTEGTYDKCYVELSTDGGATYTALPSNAYQGTAGDYGTRGYFHEDSYTLWGTTASTPDNSTWWQKESFSLSAYNVANVRLRFRVTSDGGSNRAGWYIDDISVSEPSCAAPTDLAAGSVTADSASLSWTENNSATAWEVKYSDTAGFDPDAAGTLASVSANPYSLTGLTSSTDYEYYVRSNCGGGDGDSDWAGPFSFRTLLTPIMPDYTTDFSTFLPSDWTRAGAGSPATGPSDLGSSLWSQSGSSARINLYTTNREDWLLTPPFNLSNGGYELVVNANATDFGSTSAFSGMGSDDEVQVVVSTDGGTTWTAIYTWDDSNPLSLAATDVTVDLSAYTSSNVLFAIYATDGSVNDPEDYYAIVNNLTVRTAPISYVYDAGSWNNAPEGNITSSDNLIIMSGTVALSSSISANNVTVMNGATVTASSGDVTVNGDLTNNGTIAGTSAVKLSGSAAQTIEGTGTMAHLEIDNAAGVSLDAAQSLTRELKMTNGTLNTNGNLTLKSDATGTAVVAQMNTANATVSGNVTVERFIPDGNRAYRFLGTSVSGPSVYESWQESGNNANGFGMHVTGIVGTVGTNNATTGLDETVSGNPSMYRWDNSTQNWVAVTNTKTEVLSAGTFYRTLVRGNRTTDLSVNNATMGNPVTLRATGTLATGDQMVSGNTSSATFLAVGNPYQSKVDLSLASRSSISDNVYYWDPTLNSQGAYTTIDVSSSAAGTNGSATRVLEPGQAVFLQEVAGASSIMFSEDDKVSGSNNVGILSTPNDSQFLRMKLYHTNQLQAGGNSIDGLIMKFNSSENIGYDFSDAVKLSNIDENMAISHNSGNLLAIEKRPAPSSNEVIQLDMDQYRSSNYSFTVNVDPLVGLKVYVKDNLDNSMTEVLQGSGDTVIDFTVDVNDPASVDRNRFQLVFETVTLGMGDELASTISLYPNPVSAGDLNVQLNAAVSDDLSVSIFNSIGQQITNVQFDHVGNNLIKITGLDQFAQGVYFVKVDNGGKEFSSKFIIE